MNLLSNIWQNYKAKVTENCSDDLVAETSLAYWQNRLFSASVIYLIPLSLMALIPGVYMAVITDLKGLIFTDSLAVFTVLFVAFAPSISVQVRKILFNGVLYLTSFTLLVYLGSFGPGLLYLLGISIFIVLSLGKKYGYIAVGLNTVICMAIGLLLYFDIGNFEILNQYGLDTWIAVSTNLVFLSAVSVLLIPILFDGLQSAIIKENKFRKDLENEQAKLKNSIHQLHQKNDELERFAYTVSHDLKEPLRMVRSFMELLEKRYSKQLDDKAKSYIYYAVDGARRMTKSIDDLLEYSRIGRLYSKKEQIDIHEVVDEVLHLLSAEIEKTSAKIQVKNLPVIEVAPVTIKMLFQNLISNSLKYRNEAGQTVIKINHEESNGYSKFSVSDNGIGIEEEHQAEIFEIFRRLHTREEYEGNGMGLAICKKIVEQHGGEIWVESTVGKGSTFNFTISKSIQLNEEYE